MTKKELRQLIREEARQEVYRVLPELLREAVGEVLTESVQKKQPRRQPAPRRPAPRISKRSILEEIGYGEYAQDREPDINETMHFDSRDTHNIAARAGIPVPMEGGLRSMESQMGMSNYGEMMGESEEYVPQNSSMPDPIAAAISKAKKVFDAAEARGNYRPGKK